jgi:hypothetical protein
MRAETPEFESPAETPGFLLLEHAIFSANN